MQTGKYDLNNADDYVEIKPDYRMRYTQQKVYWKNYSNSWDILQFSVMPPYIFTAVFDLLSKNEINFAKHEKF